MSCNHKFKTVNTVSHRAHKEGSKKFSSGFKDAESHGIKIITARQQQCIKCAKKRSTVEISKTQFDNMVDNLLCELQPDAHSDVLSSMENKVREYLIKVSKGLIKTRHENKAMYKEVWSYIYPSRQFGRGNTNEVVDWIVKISNFDTDNKRPPLNSLVVRGDTGMPGASWDEWRESSNTPFRTMDSAQTACWSYWE